MIYRFLHVLVTIHSSGIGLRCDKNQCFTVREVRGQDKMCPHCQVDQRASIQIVSKISKKFVSVSSLVDVQVLARDSFAERSWSSDASRRGSARVKDLVVAGAACTYAKDGEWERSCPRGAWPCPSQARAPISPSTA